MRKSDLAERLLVVSALSVSKDFFPPPLYHKFIALVNGPAGQLIPPTQAISLNIIFPGNGVKGFALLHDVLDNFCFACFCGRLLIHRHFRRRFYFVFSGFYWQWSRRLFCLCGNGRILVLFFSGVFQSPAGSATGSSASSSCFFRKAKNGFGLRRIGCPSAKLNPRLSLRNFFKRKPVRWLMSHQSSPFKASVTSFSPCFFLGSKK